MATHIYITFSLILMSLSCYILLVISKTDNNNQDKSSTIRLVNILFRHGDRSPIISYPNDPHINYSWPGGYGALSQKGSLQMFNLGKNLHKRYKELLPKNGLYSNDTIQVLSSAIERCVMSAASFLTGFISMLDENNGSPSPIPVNSVPKDKDTILRQFKFCAKYKKNWDMILTNQFDHIRKLNEQNADLYLNLTKHSGMNISNVIDVSLLHNTLLIEQDNGLMLPNWTQNIFPHKTLPLYERSLELRTETIDMKLIRGGVILTEFLNNIENYKSGLIPNKTIFIYSGHDLTIINLFRALECMNQITLSLDYAATIVFELHENNLLEMDYEIKIVYLRNSEDKLPKEIKIPNCSAPCSINNFKKSVQHLLVYDYDESCKL